jgi:hypothetical protein
VVAAKVAEGLGVSLSQLVEERREVVVVPRERRMIMRDPETGFERQLLSPSFGGRGIELIRDVVPIGSTSGEFPPHRRGVSEYVVVERGRLRALLGVRNTSWRKATPSTSRPTFPTGSTTWGKGSAVTTW